MPQIRNVETVEQLTVRARTNRASHVWLELRGRDSILELQGTRANLISIQPAADGEYDLQSSGKVVVRAGRVQQIVSAPDTVLLIDPIG